MPTKRQRRRRHRIADVSPAMWAMLTDSELEDPSERSFIDADDLRQAWEICRDRILTEWVATKGGTRPSHWWKFDAPRLSKIPGRFAGCWFAAEMIDPRRRISGAGRPSWEVLSHVPDYHLGIPALWVETGDEDPPVFETQFEYLSRHGLLAPREMEHG